MSQSNFDVESEIVKAGNQACPVSLKPWQDRLDLIAGKTTDGKSRLRIVWGQSVTMFSCGRTRLKYPFWITEDGDIGTPRFYVEELHSLSELRQKDAWERARYYYDEVSREKIDVLGPIPEEGFYTALFLVAHHDELCCNGREVVKHEPCLGAYRPPTDSDLQRVRRMKSRRDVASNDDNAPSEDLLRKRAQGFTEQRDEKWRKGIREVIDDYCRTRSHSWTTLDPAPFSWGKYHFVGKNAGHSRSGLRPEEINPDAMNAYQRWINEAIKIEDNNANSSSAAQDGA